MGMRFGRDPRFAARGPLAKIAMARGFEFFYAENDADLQRTLLKVEGDEARTRFGAAFDAKTFAVHEINRTLHPSAPKCLDSGWVTIAHEFRGDLCVQMRFGFKSIALDKIKAVNALDRSAGKPSSAPKTIKDRKDTL